MICHFGHWLLFDICYLLFDICRFCLFLLPVPSFHRPVCFFRRPVPSFHRPVYFFRRPVPFSHRPVPFSQRPVCFLPVPYLFDPSRCGLRGDFGIKSPSPINGGRVCDGGINSPALLPVNHPHLPFYGQYSAFGGSGWNILLAALYPARTHTARTL